MEMTVSSPSTIADVLSLLRKLYPDLARPILLSALNEKYVDEWTTLKDGDEVAVFTAVSGG